MLERDFQRRLIRGIQGTLPEAVILKNDAGYIQGIPDLSVIHRGRVVMIEVKASENAPLRPNQLYYLKYFTEMGTPAMLVYPEIYDDALAEIREILDR